jgi:hypothetical protein
VIPTAKTFDYKGRTLVAVPHRLDEVRVLRNMGYPAPSPIAHYYEWAGRYRPFSHQQVTAEFLTLNARAFVLNQIGCVDADTEYLSPTGWVRISEYAEGPVAQYHPDSGTIEFVQPKEFVKLPCPQMVRVKTERGVDQLLSPEHRVLVQSIYNPEKREVLSAAELLRRHDVQHIAGHAETKSREHIAFEGMGVPNVFQFAGGSGLALTDAQIRLQVAVIADGHIPHQTTRTTVRLKRERKIVRLRDLLTAASIEWAERTEPTGYVVFAFYAPLRDKTFGARWWDATRAQLQVIADEVMHWDGSFGAGNRGDRFSSTSKDSADFIQFAFNATGRTARITEDLRDYKSGACYTVHARKKGKPLQLKSVSGQTRNSTVWTEPSTDGFKYCFMVPSTFLLFRRNGCVFASGNTGKTLSVLWALDYLIGAGIIRKVLIVSPLSTLERVWGDEIFRNFPNLNAVVLYGSADKRRKLLALDADIYIVNHDGVKVLHKELAERTDIDVVVVDELAEYRNASTDRWKVLHAVTKDRPWVWGLTGSPMPKAPTDVWSQCRLLSPDRVPKYFGRFRDMVMRQVTTYKWEPRPEFKRIVYDAMQPAIIFTREECLDLPPCTFSTRTVQLSPEQNVAYRDMLTKLKSEFEGGQISAVNDAVKAMKLVQIACIAYNTEVLTSRGWIPIQSVAVGEVVWDGEDWVTCRGSVLRGHKPVVACSGVQMTEDHLVWTNMGWNTAKEVLNADASGRFDRYDVRLPDGYAAGGFDTGEDTLRHVAVPLRLRERGTACEPRAAQEQPTQREELRVRSRYVEQDARVDAAPAAQRLGEDAFSVPKPAGQRLEKLWRAGYSRMSAVGRFLRLLRRHVQRVQTGANSGADQQCSRVQPGKLCVGDSATAGVKPTHYSVRGNTERTHELVTGGESLWCPEEHVFSAVSSLRLDTRARTVDASAVDVYDLIDAGPRNRFVVRGSEGPLIVHNCGVAYDAQGNDVVFPSESRVNAAKEIVEQAEGKVILYVPLTGGLELIAKELRDDGHRVGVVHGQTPKTERDHVFAEFQNPDGEFDILVAHPQCMSHGLTLTSASVIIWYIPTNNFAVYEQACGRIVRQGQKRHQHIIHLEGSAVERRMYANLVQRDQRQGVLLDLFREEQNDANNSVN